LRRREIPNRLRLALIMILAVTLIVLAGCSSDNRQGKPYTLPSGHVIRVLSMSPLRYTNGNAPSLMFRYQTDLKTSDKAALRSEADQIWQLLQVDADKGDFRSAIISASEVPNGFIFKHSSGFNFVYEKLAGGAWRCLCDEKAGTTK
jgi:hypothetical protein